MASRLPPGIMGYVAGSEFNARRNADQLGQVHGILGLQAALEDRAFRAQMQPLQLAQLKASIDQAAAEQSVLNAVRSGILGGGGGTMPSPTPASLGAATSAPGQAGPTLERAAMLQPAGVLSGGTGIEPPAHIQLGATMQRLAPWAKMMGEAYKPTPEMRNLVARGVAPGSPEWNAELGTRFTQQGVWRFDPATGGYKIDPGFVAGQGAVKRAEQEATAAFDLVDVPIMVDGKSQGTRKATRLQAIQGLGGGTPQPTPVADLLAGRPQAEIDAIRQLQAAGSTPTTINVPAPTGGGIGTIPSRTVIGSPSESQQAADRERAVAGSKRESEAPQAGLQAGTQFDNFDRLTSMANQVLNAPGLNRAVGLVGAFPSIPGQPAANAQSLINSLKSQVSGMKLQAMRDASKTGGAVGNVTEKEWPRLESMVIALDPQQDPVQFRQQVGALIKEIQISKQRIQDAYTQEFGNTPGAVAPPSRPIPAASSGGRVVKWSDL